MSAVIDFVGGERIIQPIQLKAGDAVPSISGDAVSADLISRGVVVETYAEGDGIEVDNETPTSDQPHITITISETLTEALPFGKIAIVRVEVMTAGGVPLAWNVLYLNRVG